MKVDDLYHSKGDLCSFTKNKKRRRITQDLEMSLLICCKGKYDGKNLSMPKIYKKSLTW